MRVINKKSDEPKTLCLFLIILGLLCMFIGLFIDYETLISQITSIVLFVATIIWGLVLYFVYGITAKDSRASLINALSIYTLCIIPADVFLANNSLRWPLATSFIIALIMGMLFRVNKKSKKNRLIRYTVYLSSIFAIGLCIANYLGYIQSISYFLIGIYNIMIMFVFRYIMKK